MAKRAATPHVDPEDHDEPDPSPAAPVDESEAIDELLSQCGASSGCWISISRIEPTREYVTRIDNATEFDIEAFKREHGGGTYELRVYEHGKPGILRRASVKIDKSFRASNAAGHANSAIDMNAMLLAMMNQNAQIVSAIVSRPPPTPPTIDPTLVSLLTSKSSASELADLLKITRELAPANGETDWAQVIAAGLQAVNALGAKVPPPLPPGSRYQVARTPVGAQKGALPAISHYAGRTASQNGPTPTPTPPAQNGNGSIQQGNSAAGGTPASENPAGATPASVAEVVQAVFANVAQDPRPKPIVYAASLINLLGDELLSNVVNSTKEGEIADQVAAMLPPMPDGFLEAVEDFLREQYEPEEPEPNESAALRLDGAEVEAAA